MKKLITVLFIFTLSQSIWASLDVNIIKQTQMASLIFAGQKEGLSESTFGHIALRLSQKKSWGVTDAIIEFVADMPENEMKPIKYVRGAGINPYFVKAEVQSFVDYKAKTQIDENRDLSVYQLKLEPKQLEKLKEFLIDFKNNPDMYKYNFIFKNCSYFAIEAIEKATGVKLDYQSLPWQVPKSLGKKGLIANEVTYKKASVKRAEVVNKSLKRGLSEVIESRAEQNELIKNFESDFLFNRIYGYLKVLQVLSENKDARGVRGAKSLIRNMSMFENGYIKSYLNNIFKNEQDKIVLNLEEKTFSYYPLINKNIDHKLTIENEKVYLTLSWLYRKNQKAQGVKNIKQNMKILIKELSFDPKDNSVKYGNNVLGSFINIKNAEFILSQKLDYGFTLDRKNKRLRAVLYIDNSENFKSPKMSYEDFQNKGILALNNVKDFSQGAGSCYAMALIQKALMERALFIPENKLSSEVDKIEILNRIMSGVYVVIPGFKNIKDFTASFEKEKLLEFVNTYQQNLTKNQVSQTVENVRFLTDLDSDSIASFKGLLNQGALIPLVIAMVSKTDKSKLESNMAHVVIVQDAIKKGDDLQLNIYDPNTNMNSLLRVKKDFTLEYPFYSDEYSFIGGFKIMNMDEYAISHAVQSRKIRYSDLRGRTVSGKPLFIAPQTLLGLFE